MMVTNQNCFHKEVKGRLNSGNPYFHAVQKLCLLIFCLKNVKIKIYKTIILPLVLYGYKTYLSLGYHIEGV
jgi:hypothetical protein